MHPKSIYFKKLVSGMFLLRDLDFLDETLFG